MQALLMKIQSMNSSLAKQFYQSILEHGIDNALQWLKQQYETQPSLSYAQFYIFVLLELQAWDQCIEICIQRLSHKKDEVPTITALGKALLGLDQVEEANTVFAKGLEFSPKNAELLYLYQSTAVGDQPSFSFNKEDLPKIESNSINLTLNMRELFNEISQMTEQEKTREAETRSTQVDGVQEALEEALEKATETFEFSMAENKLLEHMLSTTSAPANDFKTESIVLDLQNPPILSYDTENEEAVSSQTEDRDSEDDELVKTAYLMPPPSHMDQETQSDWSADVEDILFFNELHTEHHSYSKSPKHLAYQEKELQSAKQQQAFNPKSAMLEAKEQVREYNQENQAADESFLSVDLLSYDASSMGYDDLLLNPPSVVEEDFDEFALSQIEIVSEKLGSKAVNQGNPFAKVQQTLISQQKKQELKQAIPPPSLPPSPIPPVPPRSHLAANPFKSQAFSTVGSTTSKAISIPTVPPSLPAIPVLQAPKLIEQMPIVTTPPFSTIPPSLSINPQLPLHSNAALPNPQKQAPSIPPLPMNQNERAVQQVSSFQPNLPMDLPSITPAMPRAKPMLQEQYPASFPLVQSPQHQAIAQQPITEKKIEQPIDNPKNVQNQKLNFVFVPTDTHSSQSVPIQAKLYKSQHTRTSILEKNQGFVVVVFCLFFCVTLLILEKINLSLTIQSIEKQITSFQITNDTDFQDILKHRAYRYSSIYHWIDQKHTQNIIALAELRLHLNQIDDLQIKNLEEIKQMRSKYDQIKVSEDSEYLHLSDALIFAKQKKYKDALFLLDQIQLKSALVYAVKGLILSKEYRYTLALEQLQKYLQKHPDAVFIHLKRLEIIYDIDGWQQAEMRLLDLSNQQLIPSSVFNDYAALFEQYQSEKSSAQLDVLATQISEKMDKLSMGLKGLALLEIAKQMIDRHLYQKAEFWLQKANTMLGNHPKLLALSFEINLSQLKLKAAKELAIQLKSFDIAQADEMLNITQGKDYKISGLLQHYFTEGFEALFEAQSLALNQIQKVNNEQDFDFFEKKRYSAKNNLEEALFLNGLCQSYFKGNLMSQARKICLDLKNLVPNHHFAVLALKSL